MDQRRKLQITSGATLLALIALIGVGVDWANRPSSPTDRKFRPYDAASQTPGQVARPDELARAEPVETAPEPQDEDVRPVAEGEGRRHLVQRARPSRDHGLSVSEDADASGREWADPINRQVLGDRRWMATPDADEAARIKAVFDRPLPHDPRVQPADRRKAIQVVREVVDQCVDDLRKTNLIEEGRLIVEFDIISRAGHGIISNVAVGPIVGFSEFVELEPCVELAEGRTFETEHDGELLHVTYPFFY